MNRGSHLVRQDAPRASYASMRPRFMNRGSMRLSRRNLIGSGSFNEAPIHESGKSVAGQDPDILPTRASMRPRFMNRGSARLVALAGQASLASMRPRFMNRGSSLIRSCRNPVQPRFNEAPIHESGKSLRRWKHTGLRAASMRPRFMNRGSLCEGDQGQLQRLRFNEAPIHESGKCECTL